MSTVASFSIRCTRFLDASGKPTSEELPEFARNAVVLIPLYRLMVLTRTFDTKAIALQRTGQLGTYASSLGQEAIGAAVGTAMGPDDVLIPSYREHAAQLARGVTLAELFLYWAGDERGSDFAACREDFPVCVPVGSQACHAVGAAAAFQIRRQPRVAVGVCGDGATSKGDFYESINIAGAWRLPVVFVVNNNQWAISVPRKAQTAAQTLAQKAVAAGFEGEQVDGNDVIALRWALDRALDKARRGGGPTLLEALSYRLHDHTTADDATRYRSPEEVSEHWKEDPIKRARVYLTDRGVWGKNDEEQLITECRAGVQRALEECMSTPDAAPESIFDFLHANLPASIARQRHALSARKDRNG